MFLWFQISSAITGVNQECSLIVPKNPLTSNGLATPFQLVATDQGNGDCNQSNPWQTTFVEAAIIDLQTLEIFIYHPLVIDQGKAPASNPVVPSLPSLHVVALWFGSNANVLTLQDFEGSLSQGNCVNGFNGSDFGPFAYCNAPAFFDSAYQAFLGGALTIPDIGTSNIGLPCPTMRDFSFADMGPTNNMLTSYLMTADGTTAQNTIANSDDLTEASVLQATGDTVLLNNFLLPALGCPPAWSVPDLTNPGQYSGALALNQLQAAVYQAPPVALLPAGHPMAMIETNFNLNKLQLLRQGLFQQVPSKMVTLANSNTSDYCTNIQNSSPSRILLEELFTSQADSPDPNMSLLSFLVNRFATGFGAGRT